MPPDPKDMACLWDMLDAARTAIEFTQGMRFDDYLRDRKTRNAVERNLEIIGEAARRVSQRIRDDHPHIPWVSIIALRNVLAHEYDEIRHERLWIICTEELSVLIREIETLGVEEPPAELT